MYSLYFIPLIDVSEEKEYIVRNFKSNFKIKSFIASLSSLEIQKLSPCFNR